MDGRNVSTCWIAFNLMRWSKGGSPAKIESQTLSPTQVALARRAKLHRVSLATLDRIAKALGVRTAELLE